MFQHQFTDRNAYWRGPEPSVLRREVANSAKAPKRKYGRNPARSIFRQPIRVRFPVTSPMITT
jgi:hypothetical protein